MTHRTLIGTALNIQTGRLLAIPIEPTPAEAGSGMLIPGTPVEFPIVGGELTGTIIVPAIYRFVFYDGHVAGHSFVAGVPDDDFGPISIEEVYRSRMTPTDVLPYVVRRGDPIGYLVAGEGDDARFLGQGTNGVLVWRDFEGTHSHDIVEVAGLVDALAGKSPVVHTHSMDDVDDLLVVLDAKADDRDVEAIQGNLTAHRTEPVLDHPDGSVTDAKLGVRIIDDSLDPSGSTGMLGTLLGWLARMVRAITGEVSWRTMPATTLAAARQHADAVAPHPGHLKKAPAVVTDNEVQAGSAGYPILRMKRHALSTDADTVWELRSADGGSVLMAVNAKGNVGIGGVPDATALEYGLHLIGRRIQVSPGEGLRERGFGSHLYLGANNGNNVQIGAPLQVGAIAALPSGQLEVNTRNATTVTEYLRLAAAQTANAVEVRSSDGGTLHYALSPGGIVLHSGIQSLGGNARGNGAVDLQTVRTSAGFVAAAANSGVLSGRSNQTTTSAYCGVVVGGETCTVAGQWSVAAGRGTVASSDWSMAIGDYIGTRWPSSISFGPGRLVSVLNETHRCLLGIAGRTTDQTPTMITALTIAAKFTGLFSGWLIARRSTGGADIGAWELRALVTKDQSGTPSIILSSATPIHNPSSYAVAFSVDTATTQLRLGVTGVAGHDIAWSGTLIVTDSSW